jgi:hypothetical protein
MSPFARALLAFPVGILAIFTVLVIMSLVGEALSWLFEHLPVTETIADAVGSCVATLVMMVVASVVGCAIVAAGLLVLNLLGIGR